MGVSPKKATERAKKGASILHSTGKFVSAMKRNPEVARRAANKRWENYRKLKTQNA